MLKLQPSNEEALKELEALRPLAAQDFAGSSSHAGGSTKRKLPFELCDVDFAPLKVLSMKKSWQIPGKTAKETYVYPQWDLYDIQML